MVSPSRHASHINMRKTKKHDLSPHFSRSFTIVRADLSLYEIAIIVILGDRQNFFSSYPSSQTYRSCRS